MNGPRVIGVRLGPNATELQILGVVNTHRSRRGLVLWLVVGVALPTVQDGQLPQLHLFVATSLLELQVLVVVEALGIAALAGFGFGFTEVADGFVLGDFADQGAVVVGAFSAGVDLDIGVSTGS